MVFRVVFSLVVVVVVAALVASLARNRVIRQVASRVIAEQTGLEVRMGGLEVGIFNPMVRVRDLHLTNPPGFPVEEALAVDEVFVRYQRRSLFGDKVVLPELSVALDHLVMVRTTTGESNLDRTVGDAFDGLWPRRAEAPGRREEGGEERSRERGGVPERERKARGPERQVEIGTLTVRVGEIRMIDHYGREERPMQVVVPLNYQRTFHNVTNLNELGKQIGTDIGFRAAPYLLGQIDQILDLERGVNRESIRELEGQVKGLLRGLRRPE